MRFGLLLCAAAASLWPAAAIAADIDAAKLFMEQCSACHQPTGQGVPGQFPPLARNRDLFASREFVALDVLFGMTGKIEVGGTTIDGVMPPLGEMLNDAQIAAVVNYVRSHFGNEKLAPAGFQPLDAATVAGLRKRNLSPEQVHALRQQLLGKK